jgi:hypothetical protein
MFPLHAQAESIVAEDFVCGEFGDLEDVWKLGPVPDWATMPGGALSSCPYIRNWSLAYAIR